MYGLSKDIDLSFFNGKVLLQACFGVYELILNFDGDVSVTVFSSVGCKGPGDSIHRYEDLRLAAPLVLNLLHQTVKSTEGNEAGTLTLNFDGGGILIIYDDSPEYKSYTIGDGGGGQFIVV